MKITLTETELHTAILESLTSQGFTVPEDAEIRIIAGRGANGSYAEIDTDHAEDIPLFPPDPKPSKPGKPKKKVKPEPEPEVEVEEPSVEVAPEPEVTAEATVSPDQSALFDD